VELASLRCSYLIPWDSGYILSPLIPAWDATMNKLLGDKILSKETIAVEPITAPALCAGCMDGDGPLCVECVPPVPMEQVEAPVLMVRVRPKRQR
jgi:hypothetical protein